MSGEKTAPPVHVSADLVADFDFYDPPNVSKDFHLAWNELLQQHDSRLIWTPRNGGHWIPLRGEDIRTILADHERFSTHIVSLPETRGKDQPGIPTTLSPPEHGPYRALLNHALAPKVVRDLKPRIRALAIQSIEGFRQSGQCDFNREYAMVLPLGIFMQLVNLPPEDIPRLKFLADQVTRPDGSMTMEQIMTGFTDYLAPYLDKRRESPEDDPLSYMANGEINGERIEYDYAMSLCVQLLIGGMDTVASFLGFMMTFLANNPGHRQELLDEPGLIPRAVAEFLRRFAIVSLVRTVRRDMDFHGIALKKGDHFSVPTMLHGLDESEYEEPLKVDFRRRVGKFSTFGNGVHRCPGALLAQTEIRITLEEWLARIPDFSVDDSTPVAMRGGVVGNIESLKLSWEPSTTRRT